MSSIIRVEFNLLWDGEVVASIDLCPSCQSGNNLVNPFLSAKINQIIPNQLWRGNVLAIAHPINLSDCAIFLSRENIDRLEAQFCCDGARDVDIHVEGQRH